MTWCWILNWNLSTYSSHIHCAATKMKPCRKVVSHYTKASDGNYWYLAIVPILGIPDLNRQDHLLLILASSIFDFWPITRFIDFMLLSLWSLSGNIWVRLIRTWSYWSPESHIRSELLARLRLSPEACVRLELTVLLFINDFFVKNFIWFDVALKYFPKAWLPWI